MLLLMVGLLVVQKKREGVLVREGREGAREVIQWTLVRDREKAVPQTQVIERVLTVYKERVMRERMVMGERRQELVAGKMVYTKAVLK